MMDTSAHFALQDITTAVLTPIVRQVLQCSHAEVLDWQVEQLGGGAGNPVSVGLFRFSGSAQDQDKKTTWSLILKVIQSPANAGLVNMGEGEDPAHWNYWKREPLVYQSGLLDTLPNGLAVPRCWDVTELPGNISWLWLEDIRAEREGSWPLARYALTARHLGRLNGFYLAQRPLPAFNWYSRERIRQWIDMLPWRGIPWDHPRILARYPRPAQNAFKRMLDQHERFLTKLEELPLTISHGDTYPTNFKSRFAADGAIQTVALDWALMGTAPLGDDLGQFVLGAQNNLPETALAEVDRVLFASYIDGLRDCDCRVDERLVRFGYTALAALRVGLFQLYLLNEEINSPNQDKSTGVPPAALSTPFEAAMAEKAFQLLNSLEF
jgi:hypothetical protein